MSMSRISDPASEPVSLEEARLHLKVDAEGSPATHPDDDLIAALIKAAREWCETYTGRSFFEQTWQVKLDEFPKVIRLPREPIISVTSIQYVDLAGNTQTLSSSMYRVDLQGARITPGYTKSWPAAQEVTGAVTVEYVTGYDSGNSPQDASTIPSAVKAAILLIVAALYEYREDQSSVNVSSVPWSAKALLGPYIVDKHGATV